MACLCDFSVRDFCVVVYWFWLLQLFCILSFFQLNHHLLFLVTVSLWLLSVLSFLLETVIVRVVRGTEEVTEQNFQMIYCQIRCCRHLFLVDAKLLRVEEQSPKITRKRFQKLGVIFHVLLTGCWQGLNIFWYPVVKKIVLFFFFQINFLLPTSVFFDMIKGLLHSNSGTVRRKAMGLLNSNLGYHLGSYSHDQVFVLP